VTNLPGVGAHTYDGRNRVTSVAGGSARGYDPGNKKIWWKDEQANLYVDFYGPGGKLGTYQLFMPANGSAVPLFGKVAEYTYFAGRLVKGEGPWTNGFVQQDRLGSAVTHLPYGDERSVTAQGLLKFATYWREHAGVDYADQRYYSSTYGRFLTSDPYRASGGPSDPGSWNRYAYTRGDPVNRVDPSGLFDHASPEIDYDGLYWDAYHSPISDAVGLREPGEVYPYQYFMKNPFPSGWSYDCVTWTCDELRLSLPTSVWGAAVINGLAPVAVPIAITVARAVVTVVVRAATAWALLQLVTKLPDIKGKTPSQWVEEITYPRSGWKSVPGDPSTWQRDCPPGSRRSYETVHYDEGIRYNEGVHYDVTDCDGKTWKDWPDGRRTPARSR
jgi:RHS repeat-associated protein